MPLCGDDHKNLIDRVNRVEGQIRGIRKMIEEDRDCMDVLKQIAAAVGALRGAGMLLVEDHLKGCVSDAIRRQGDHEELIRQVVDIFKKFSK